MWYLWWDIFKNFNFYLNNGEVQERKILRFCHWEADLIKGKDNNHIYKKKKKKKKGKSSIATLIERNTRLCILATLPDAKAEFSAQVL